MSDDESATGLGELAYDESYGPIARSATPTEHVYFTVVTFGRWFVAFASAGFIVFVDWVIRISLAEFPPTLQYLFIPSFGLMALALLVLAVLVLYVRAEVTISPVGITMRRRGMLFGRGLLRCWRLEDLASVEVAKFQTFHIGGSTFLYYLLLRFSTGEDERFGGTFGDVPATRKAADAILQSVRRMSGTT